MSLIYCVKDKLVVFHSGISERLVTHNKWIFMCCVEQQDSAFSLMMISYDPLKVDVKFCMKIENTCEFGMIYIFCMSAVTDLMIAEF
jgi:hypothetical protein